MRSAAEFTDWRFGLAPLTVGVYWNTKEDVLNKDVSAYLLHNLGVLGAKCLPAIIVEDLLQ